MVETGQVSPKGPRPQRNFLRDYDLMLKVMQQDYVDCARYVASGYAEFIGQLYTLNSGMFQSPVYCDHILTQMAMHYLAWYQDPSVRLEVGPGAAWHMAQTYGTQRCGDALYVVWAQEGSPVLVGERIVGVNKKTLEEIRPEVERMLHTTVEPVDHEREDWSLVLAFAKHLTVIGTDGTERTIKVVPGESAVTGRMRCLYAGRGEGPAAVEERGEACGGTGGRSREACTLSWHGPVAVLTLHDLGAEGFSTLLEEALGELASAVERPRGLVVDVRGATGGVWDEVYPLMPYLLRDGAKATPADAFGVPGVLLNCSRRNVDERLAALDGIRSTLVGGDGALLEGASLEELGQVDALMGELTALRGCGLQADETDYYTPAEFVGVEEVPVVVLADRHTADGAEWLAKATVRLRAADLGRALLVGRATCGSIDNTCLREVRLDEDFVLTVPTAKYLAALGGDATLGRGVIPHVKLAWTPEQLERDVELEQACALLGENA